MESTRNVKFIRLQWVGHVFSTERTHRKQKTSWKTQRKRTDVVDKEAMAMLKCKRR
jgi:hypothetical protein